MEKTDLWTLNFIVHHVCSFRICRSNVPALVLLSYICYGEGAAQYYSMNFKFCKKIFQGCYLLNFFSLPIYYDKFDL